MLCWECCTARPPSWTCRPWVSPLQCRSGHIHAGCSRASLSVFTTILFDVHSNENEWTKPERLPHQVLQGSDQPCSDPRGTSLGPRQRWRGWWPAYLGRGCWSCMDITGYIDLVFWHYPQRNGLLLFQLKRGNCSTNFDTVALWLFCEEQRKYINMYLFFTFAYLPSWLWDNVATPQQASKNAKMICRIEKSSVHDFEILVSKF